MQNIRQERKYLLNFHQYQSLRNTVAKIMPPDKFTQKSSKKSYPIFSQYWDTNNLDFFYQKIDGEFDHLKIRLRSYAHSLKAPFYLEAKIKVDGKQIKLRSVVKTSNIENIFFDIKNNFPKIVKQSPFTNYFESILLEKTLAPTCCVHYEREAYECFLEKQEKFRISFDHRIKAFHWSDYKKPILKKQTLTDPLNSSPFVLMEVKCSQNTYPEFFKRILYQYSLKQIAFSKYTLCLQSLQNEYLPHSKLSPDETSLLYFTV